MKVFKNKSMYFSWYFGEIFHFLMIQKWPRNLKQDVTALLTRGLLMWVDSRKQIMWVPNRKECVGLMNYIYTSIHPDDQSAVNQIEEIRAVRRAVGACLEGGELASGGPQLRTSRQGSKDVRLWIWTRNYFKKDNIAVLLKPVSVSFISVSLSHFQPISGLLW